MYHVIFGIGETERYHSPQDSFRCEIFWCWRSLWLVFGTNFMLDNVFPPGDVCSGSHVEHVIFTDCSSITAWCVCSETLSAAFCTNSVCMVSLSVLAIVFYPCSPGCPIAATHWVSSRSTFLMGDHFSTRILCRGIPGFLTDCSCGVWCRRLTTCLLCLS